jgi:hypothetical protein
MLRSTSIHYLHQHRESSLSSNYYSQPLGSISTHATTHSNTFQNGTAYPTDPLYNLLAPHLILELPASEWLAPHQTEQVTHQSFISGVDLSQTSQQIRLLSPRAIPFIGATFSLLPLAVFFFKSQHFDTVSENSANSPSLEAKNIRFSLAQQLSHP